MFKTLHQIATDFENALIEETKSDGKTKYIKLADDAPEWMNDAVREAHRADELAWPNDNLWYMVRNAAEAITETMPEDCEGMDFSEGLTDDLLQYLAGIVPVYNSGLREWQQQNPQADEWQEKALQEGFSDPSAEGFTLDKLRAAGYLLQLEHITETLLQAINTQFENQDFTIEGEDRDQFTPEVDE